MDEAYDSTRAMWSRLFWPIAALVVVSIATLFFRHALVAGFRRWTGHRNEGAARDALSRGFAFLRKSLAVPFRRSARTPRRRQ
jgi:hypothetical protein